MLRKFQGEIIDLDTNLETGEISQFTIDFVEDLYFEFGWNHRDNEKEPITRDCLGSKMWEITLALDIIKPELKKDIEILKKAEKILKEYQDYLESLPETKE